MEMPKYLQDLINIYASASLVYIVALAVRCYIDTLNDYRAERGLCTMKNTEIIEEIAREIWGDNVVDEMIANDEDIPLHTLAEWRRRLPSAHLAEDAEGHITNLWFVSQKTKRPYQKCVILYEKKDIII